MKKIKTAQFNGNGFLKEIDDIGRVLMYGGRGLFGYDEKSSMEESFTRLNKLLVSGGTPPRLIKHIREIIHIISLGIKNPSEIIDRSFDASDKLEELENLVKASGTKTAQFNNGRDIMGFFPTFIATNHDETEATTGKNAEVYYKISKNSGSVEITKIEVDGIKIDLSVIPPVYLKHFKQKALEHNETRNRG